MESRVPASISGETSTDLSGVQEAVQGLDIFLDGVHEPIDLLRRVVKQALPLDHCHNTRATAEQEAPHRSDWKVRAQ